MSGIISAGSQGTAQAGAKILQMGGNAVDAAVAAAFASFMAEIGVVHLGGSGIAQIFDPATGQTVVYDFFSDTPGLGLETMPQSLNFAGVTIDFGATTQDFHLGRASVAVPGNIFGLCQMALDFGRLPLATLLEPAIEMAREGIPLEPFQAGTCSLLEPLYTHTQSMRDIFQVDGRMIAGNERLFIAGLADTLTKLGQLGADFLRTGALGQALVADQRANNGLLTHQDLLTYRVPKNDPIRIQYREHEVLLPPPCSIGGVLTAFALKVMVGFEVGTYTHGSADHLRLFAEVMGAASRARQVWEEWVLEMPASTAIHTFLHPDFIQPYIEEVRQAMASGIPHAMQAEPNSHNNTSHLSVVDSDGLAVSLTTTAGESAGYVVPGTGFIPNNIMGEGDLHPNGFHSRPAGERIQTMMTPTIVLKDGKVRLVVGSGGSMRIRSAILQVLSNLLDFEMKLDKAVNIERVHLEHGVLQCEAGFDPTAVAKMTAMGYKVNCWDRRSIYFGGAHSVSRTLSGRLVAAGDNRRGGAVATGG